MPLFRLYGTIFHPFGKHHPSLRSSPIYDQVVRRQGIISKTLTERAGKGKRRAHSDANSIEPTQTPTPNGGVRSCWDQIRRVYTHTLTGSTPSSRASFILTHLIQPARLLQNVPVDTDNGFTLPRQICKQTEKFINKINFCWQKNKKKIN